MKLVIFDMDGLMFATEGIDMKCFKKACDEFGYIIEEKFQMELIGMNEHDTVLKLQEKFGEAFPVYDICIIFNFCLRNNLIYKIFDF